MENENLLRVFKNRRHVFIKTYIKNLDLKELGVLNVSIIAKLFRTNADYLSRNFKDNYGIKLCFYIKKKKMEKSAEILLNDCDIKVEDVVRLAGYSRRDYFRKLFKQIIGKTPKECKKR